MTAQGSFLNRRLVEPIQLQLRQGITPEKIALTIALGAVLGVFPILGSTMLLCGLAAWQFKLNQPIIQVVNYFVYPLQLILLLPFYRLGEILFRQPHVPIFSVTALLQRFADGPLQFVRDYGMAALYGVAVWCLLAPLVAVALYFGLRPLLRTLSRRIGTLHTLSR
ncbi:MAG: DUF2062 domain-containing protein [Stenotrophobium sp.]